MSVINLSLGTFILRNYVGGTVSMDEARDVLAKYGAIGRLEEIDRDVAELHGIDQGVLVEFKNFDPDRDIQAVSAFTLCEKSHVSLTNCYICSPFAIMLSIVSLAMMFTALVVRITRPTQTTRLLRDGSILTDDPYSSETFPTTSKDSSARFASWLARLAM